MLFPFIFLFSYFENWVKVIKFFLILQFFHTMLFRKEANSLIFNTIKIT